MSTVRMKKGKKFADVNDSPEMIRRAQLEGWSIVEGQDFKVKKQVVYGTVIEEQYSPGDRPVTARRTRRK